MKYPNLELIEYITENTANVLFEELMMRTVHRYKMYVFPQTWSTTALGFDKIGCCSGQAFTEAYTTVVKITLYKIESGEGIRGIIYEELDDKIYAVLFDGKIAYMCLNPNHKFLKDLSNMRMKSQREARYNDETLNEDKSRIYIL